MQILGNQDGSELENFIFAVFSLVGVLVASPKFRHSVQSALPDLMYYVCKFMQITEDQVSNCTLLQILCPSLIARWAGVKVESG